MVRYMENYDKKEKLIDYDELDIYSDEGGFSDVLTDAVSEATVAQAGIQTISLQAAMDNYAIWMNESAIAKSTGLPVRTPTQQYKGFAAEEHFKNTLKINALAKGVPSSKIGIYTKGQMPDGSTLSGIDMETDISVWTRKHPWCKPVRTVDYQSKIHNDPSAYANDIKNPQYDNVNFVGGAGQGVNDTVTVKIGNTTVSSDSITPEEAAELADRMKAQSTPEYGRKREKFDELNKITRERAIAMGAASGLIFSTIREIVDVIRNRKDLPGDQFVRTIKNILCGTVEGGIRSGAIVGSVQVFSKLIGKEVAANSLAAIPITAFASVTVDFAKDLYHCFISKTIDTDDLLCNTVNNSFSSVSGFGGAWAAGHVTEIFLSAKTAAETGAGIGSSLGPIGAVIGSVVGGLVIGLAAKGIINTANKDAQKAFTDTIAEINSHIELEGFAKMYYFADSMATLSEFRLSFKDLLPCYNLISDLREYNIHKKAIRNISEQIESVVDSSVENEKTKALKQLEEHHKEQVRLLNQSFHEQSEILKEKFYESVDTYVATSYAQYVELYSLISSDTDEMLSDLENRKTEHSYILGYIKHRNEINEQINATLQELMLEPESQEYLLPFIDQVNWFIQQDELIVGRQYISFEESMLLVSRGR